MYFNATENTMKIWILTVIAIIALYECAKHLINLMIHKSARYSMIFLFCLSIFSHYYAWWAYVNYYNDDFFSQWNHQTLFSVCVCNMLLIIFYFLNKISFKLELDLYKFNIISNFNNFNKNTIIPMMTIFWKHTLQLFFKIEKKMHTLTGLWLSMFKNRYIVCPRVQHPGALKFNDNMVSNLDKYIGKKSTFSFIKSTVKWILAINTDCGSEREILKYLLWKYLLIFHHWVMANWNASNILVCWKKYSQCTISYMIFFSTTKQNSIFSYHTVFLLFLFLSFSLFEMDLTCP